jgi:hypothetical protein
VTEGQASLPLKSSAFLRSCGVKTTDGEPASFDLSGSIRLAFSRCDMSIKVACAHMSLDQGLFSRQLAGDGHISLPRLLLLPEAFWLEFLPLLAHHFGASVTSSTGVSQSISRCLVAMADVIGRLELATGERKVG